MKKLIQISILLLIAQFSFGQSVEITPSQTTNTNTSGDNVMIQSSDNLIGLQTFRFNGTINAKTPVMANNTLLRLGGGGYYTSTNRFTETAAIIFRATENWSDGVGAGTKITFHTTPNGSITPAERMVIDHNGFVGIGNSSPADLLHLSPISNTGSVYTRLSSTNGLTGLRLQNAAGDWSIYSNEFSKLFFGYSSDNFATNAQVLILEPTGTQYNFIPSTTNQVYLGTSSNRWREIWSQNPLNTSSDRRLKKDIATIKYGLEEVLKLNAVSYRWKNNSDTKLHLGFIAQEVDKIIPEIVSKSNLSDEEFEKLAKKGDLPSDTYGMEYTGLIPVLVKAIQEQQQIIQDKSLKISQLEEKLKQIPDLEARLSAIEALLNKSNNQEVISDKK